MNQQTDSRCLHFPSPSGSAAPNPAEPAAAGGAKRGRQSTYAPRVIDMLCDSIRQLGLSDSAAAEQQGMSTSTLSRWKQLYPEVGIKLKQARQEIRAFHLQRVFEQSAAENGKGWRASTWILERLFPGDYAPRVKDRLDYLDLENRVRNQETTEALNEQLRELHEMQAEERAAAQAAATAQAAQAEAARLVEEARAAQVAEAAAQAEVPIVATGLWPVPVSGDEQGDGESRDATDGDAETAHRAVATTGAAACETQFYSEEASHNSRNAPEGSAGAAHPPHPQQAAASTKRQQAAAVQGGCAAGEGASTGEGRRVDSGGRGTAEKGGFTYGSVSHNSRNAPLPAWRAEPRGEGQPCAGSSGEDLGRLRTLAQHASGFPD